jgi:hypothetical protein
LWPRSGGATNLKPTAQLTNEPKSLLEGLLNKFKYSNTLWAEETENWLGWMKWLKRSSKYIQNIQNHKTVFKTYNIANILPNNYHTQKKISSSFF